ncbi:MAG: hypothetical protein KDN19_16845 [Verrucomicrobiae bacterium]|nr:hypothetical protein [Verrucomicrobiae bacterium]
MNKVIRILAYLVLVVAVLGVGIRIVDSVRFSVARPVDAKTCNYEGSWESESAPMVKGRILAELPLPLPEDEPFTVKAFVYYNVTSLYRAGSFVPLQMEGFVSASGTVSGDNADDPVNLPPRITFKSKGGAGGDQTIDYVSTADGQFTRITGGYRSSSPYDIGTFTLKKMR